jgi:hypothetical protein
MALPAGKTCRDCAHARECEWFLATWKPTWTRCDWSPSRFLMEPVLVGSVMEKIVEDAKAAVKRREASDA